MQAKTMERWAWVLIFGGGLVGSLGIFMLRAGAPVGWALAGLAAVAVVAGVVLILVRARMSPSGVLPSGMPPSGTPPSGTPTSQTKPSRTPPSR